MDDEDRENEGDLIISAEKATTEQMAFLIRHSSGYVCVPMLPERADKLNLPLMIPVNTDRHGTAYTVTCDFREGTTTGISAHDRGLTVRKLADPSVTALEFMQPGHVCPLRAKPGLLRERRGHTEAAVELCQLVGHQPVGAICELVREEDGDMMRLDDCVKFGKKHNIKVINLNQLMAYMDKQ